MDTKPGKAIYLGILFSRNDRFDHEQTENLGSLNLEARPYLLCEMGGVRCDTQLGNMMAKRAG